MSKLYKVEPSDFIRLVRDAAFLAREFFGQQESLSFEEDGGENIYVVDSGILTGFAAASRHGPKAFGGAYGYGELLPQYYPIQYESGLTDLEKAELKRSRQENALSAVGVSSLLCATALQWATKTRLDIDGKRKQDLDGFQVYVLPSHIREHNQTAQRFKREAGYQSRGETPEQGRHRANRIAEQLASLLKRRNQNEDEISPEGLLENLIDFTILTEANNSIGAAEVNAKYVQIEAMPFEFEDLAKSKALRNFPISDPPEEDEEFARGFLTWHFSVLLESKKRRHEEASRNGFLGFEEHTDNAYESDFHALTHLAMLNFRLLSLGVKTRVVFLTTDRTIVRSLYSEGSKFSDRYEDLVQQYLLQRSGSVLESENIRAALSRVFKSNDNPNWFDHFGLHYVRHIHALAHNTIAEEIDPSSLTTIFSGLFAFGQQDNLRKLEKIALGGETPPLAQNFAEDYRERISSWLKVTKKALRKKRVDRIEEDASEAYGALVDMLVRGQHGSIESAEDREKVGFLINEYLEQQRDETMLSFSDLGTDLLIQKGSSAGWRRHNSAETWIVRNPPDLFFSRLRNTRDMFERLSSPEGYIQMDTSAFSRDLDKLYEDVIFDQSELSDPEKRMFTSYLKFLVLGAAFAAAEKWSVAHGHASKAVAITERAEKLGRLTGPLMRAAHDFQIDDVVMFSGREANFLLAVCERALAKNPDHDIQLAHEKLARAKEIFETDTARGETNNAERIRLRFDAEFVGIELARFYLTRKYAKSQANREGDIDLQQREREAFAKLAEAADSAFSSERLSSHLKLRRAENVTNVSVALYVIQLHLAQDLLGVPKRNIKSKGVWRKASTLKHSVEILQASKKEENLIISRLAEAFMLAGEYLLDPQNSVKPWSSEGEVARFFRDLSLFDVTEFDSIRFEDLETIMKRNLKRS